MHREQSITTNEEREKLMKSKMGGRGPETKQGKGNQWQAAFINLAAPCSVDGATMEP